MGANLNQGGGYESEINITPLVDVVLVLLIIFMVIVPVMMRGYDVSVPGEATSAPPEQRERPEQLVLHIELASCPIASPPDGDEIASACSVRINEQVVPVDELAATVSESYAERTGDDRVLFLAADAGSNYEQVMRIVDLARSETDDLRIGVVVAG